MKEDIQASAKAVSEQRGETRPSALWFGACVVVTVAAAFLRFFELGLKPFHHDEGVNGSFLMTLFNKGTYSYDPANYHGPTLYYIADGFAKVFGLETVPVRASMAIFGVLMVVLIFFLWRHIGQIGSLAAALLVALSPGMVYISRYFIHEIFFVFLSLAFVVAVLFFIEKRKAGPLAVAWMVVILLVCFLPSAFHLADNIGGSSSAAQWAIRGGFLIIEAVLIYFVMRMLTEWNAGRPIYLLLASATLAFNFATKETGFITIGTMLIACACIWIWQKVLGKNEDSEITWANLRAAFGSRGDMLLMVAAAGVVFLYIAVLFFSSYFSNFDGVGKALEAYTFWTTTGTKDHAKPFLTYVGWLLSIEAAIFLLTPIGVAIAFYKGRNKFAMFVALWAVGLFIAYSIIPYKTPWLLLSFLLPMAIIGGYAINEVAAVKAQAAKIAAFALLVAACGTLGYQAYDLNFVNYDNNSQERSALYRLTDAVNLTRLKNAKGETDYGNDLGKYVYIYQHTERGFLDLMGQIGKYSDKSGKGKNAAVEIVSPDYWPMVWYTKDYPNAVYRGGTVDLPEMPEIIVSKKGQQDSDILGKYSANYRWVGIYPLRTGIQLVLLVRKDLAGSEGKEIWELPSKY